MKYFIRISYDGSNFDGFQRLKNNRSVQAEIERVLSIINKEEVKIKGASRTDKGVHAYGQCADFELKVKIPVKKLMVIINNQLSPDVKITECKKVKDDFRARFDVKRKKYVYKINLGKYDPLKHNYYYQVNYDMNLKIMKKCAKYFLGVHSFNNFVAGPRENYDAIIYSISFKKKNDILEIEFIGKSFYRYMVRNLVGALVWVGVSKCNLDYIKSMVEEPNVKRQLPCAPPQGLYLMEIKY